MATNKEKAVLQQTFFVRSLKLCGFELLQSYLCTFSVTQNRRFAPSKP
jgi:hypothetical protein